MDIKSVALIFLAGGLGALSRFGLSAVVNSAAGYQFPLGTLAVNISGCLLFGFFWALAEHFDLNQQIRLIVMTGFLGAFTTFSSMIFESYTLNSYRLPLVFLNLAAHLAGGFAAFFSGLKLCRLFWG